MNTVITPVFLTWAKSRQIFLGHDDAPSSRPQYKPCRNLSRFWNYPTDPRKYPFFIAHVLDGLSPAWPCYLWMRFGRWSSKLHSRKLNPASPSDLVHDCLFAGSQVPQSFEGALLATDADRAGVLTIAFAQMCFGSSVNDDLFILPEHGRGFLYFDHHDAIHADFADPAALHKFIEHMAAKQYKLPEELPDCTFKKREWISRT